MFFRNDISLDIMCFDGYGMILIDFKNIFFG